MNKFTLLRLRAIDTHGKQLRSPSKHCQSNILLFVTEKNTGTGFSISHIDRNGTAQHSYEMILVMTQHTRHYDKKNLNDPPKKNKIWR